ncbi:MAG: hypothetical protein HY834_14780 [Devosia nanyangense]|uniref:Uncharacterized protein n=1 Tax=Devosia nanyangense TaxID=1228055 RepID=A0A933L4P4_9HYPH|nr:hypothetical protein [Devosia nanyangense]
MNKAERAIRKLAESFRVVDRTDIDRVLKPLRVSNSERWDIVGCLVREGVLVPRLGGGFHSLAYLGDAVTEPHSTTFEGETMESRSSHLVD